MDSNENTVNDVNGHDTVNDGQTTEVVENTSDDVQENDIDTEGNETESVDEKTPSAEEQIELLKKANEKKTRYADNKRKEAAEARARSRELEVQLQKLLSNQQTKEAPKMDNFDSVLDFVKADTEYTLEQKMSEQTRQQQLMALEQQKALLNQQINEQNGAKYQELAQVNPDVKVTLESPEVSALIQAMPDHIDRLFSEVDNPALAGYVLAKEGRLADLAYMHPQVALVEIVQAMHRGQQFMQQAARPKPQAPNPIGSVKGVGKSSTKPLHLMTPSELDKWRRS